MRIILTQHVKFLGEQGELKDVAEGYAINYLMPQGLALPATTQNLVRLEDRKKRQAKIAVMELNEAEALARALDGQHVTVIAKVNASGTLYAAVTEKQIFDILKKKKFSLSKQQIILPETIKEPGDYEFTVNLPHGLEARLTLTVRES